MNFHALSYEFYYKGKEINELVLCEEVNESNKFDDNIQLVYVLNHQNKKLLFGDIYKLGEEYYALLFQKYYQSINFQSYGFAKLTYSNTSTSLDTSFIYHSKQLVDDILKDGVYMGNIYLHKKTLSTFTIDFVKTNKDAPILQMDVLKYLREDDSSKYGKQYKMDLHFEGFTLNAFNRHDWDSLFANKHEDFSIDVPVNDYLLKPTSKIDSKMKEILSTSLLNTKSDMPHYRTGLLISASYNEMDIIKQVQKANKRELKEEDIIDIDKLKNDLLLFKNLFVCINENGKPEVRSAELDEVVGNNNDDYDARPYISILSGFYEFISDKENEVYQDNLLKII